jgi:TonB-dependent Receptor Plug Domain
MADRGSSGVLCLAACMLPLLAFATEPAAPAPANPATVQELPQVTVIGNTPLAGLGLPRDEIPADVQTGDSGAMQRQLSLDLGEYLNDNFSGVYVSEGSASPLQPEVTYHGFTASPLLGTPQGLSVYVDGVRVNESFGDTVNWDLLPQSAISTVTLISGSNPVFGLNTLGGALSVRTKSGHEDPGSELGCASPSTPCGLPNQFAGDPDLQQVVARTAELACVVRPPGRGSYGAPAHSAR